MITKPILFSAPMVRALLAGSKTQTRRLLKADIPTDADEVFTWFRKADWQGEQAESGVWARQNIKDDYDGGSPHGGYLRHIAPLRWEPGDLLWVRETWQAPGKPATKYGPVYYEADKHFFMNQEFPLGRGVPSIHMPRWASRLTLEVTNVRVQRLQDISEEDAKAEGMSVLPMAAWADARTVFFTLWNEILKHPDAWLWNSWVVAVSFTVIKANIDEVLAQREAA